MMYWHWHDGYGWATFVVNLLFWLLVIGAITWVVLSLAGRNGQGSDATGEQGSQALSILKERFARGEISEEEFRHRRDLLLH
jgi:putative membrane protein